MVADFELASVWDVAGRIIEEHARARGFSMRVSQMFVKGPAQAVAGPAPASQ
jgi:hypothetical protein